MITERRSEAQQEDIQQPPLNKLSHESLNTAPELKNSLDIA